MDPQEPHVCVQPSGRAKITPQCLLERTLKTKEDCQPLIVFLFFEPLWKGALKKPSIKIDGLPFIWEDNGIIYRSSSLAFEKNMWIASSAHNHWNAAIGNNIDKSTALIRHIRPALEGLNHLIDDNGLTQDLSRPADEDLLPVTIRKKRLEILQNGFRALAYSYSADTSSTVLDENDVGGMSIYFRRKHKAAEIGRQAKPLLSESWCNSREAEAGRAYSDLEKKKYEANPNQTKCLSAYEAYTSTAHHIGMGVTTRSDVNKNDIVKNQKQCLSDLKLVIGLTESKVKSILKSFKPRPIKFILDNALVNEDNVESNDLKWINNKTFAGDETIQINLN